MGGMACFYKDQPRCCICTNALCDLSATSELPVTYCLCTGLYKSSKWICSQFSRLIHFGRKTNDWILNNSAPTKFGTITGLDEQQSFTDPPYPSHARKTHPTRYHVHEAQAKECTWFSWFIVLYCFIVLWCVFLVSRP